MTRWSNRQDIQFAGIVADRIQMVIVVPEHLDNGIGGQQVRVRLERVGSMEVDNPSRPATASNFPEGDIFMSKGLTIKVGGIFL